MATYLNSKTGEKIAVIGEGKIGRQNFIAARRSAINAKLSDGKQINTIRLVASDAGVWTDTAFPAHRLSIMTTTFVPAAPVLRNARPISAAELIRQDLRDAGDFSDTGLDNIVQ